MPRDIRSYEHQGRRSFRDGKSENPYKKPEIREAWQRGYDAARREDEAAAEKGKVVRWEGYGGNSFRGRPHTQYELGGEAPRVSVHRSSYCDGWLVSCHSWGIDSLSLQSLDIDGALAEALRTVLVVMKDRLAEIQRIAEMPKIEVR